MLNNQMVIHKFYMSINKKKGGVIYNPQRMVELFAERWRSPSIHEIGFKKWTYWATLCQAICFGDKLRSRRFHIFPGHGNHLVKLNLTELGPWWMVWVRGPVRDFGWLWGIFLKMSFKMNLWSLEMYIIPAFAGKPWKIQNSSSSVACRWSRAALLGALRRCWNRMQSAANSSEMLYLGETWWNPKMKMLSPQAVLDTLGKKHIYCIYLSNLICTHL